MEEIESVDDVAAEIIDTKHTGWTNGISKTLKLPQKEGVYYMKQGKSCFKLSMKLEQKNTAWTKNILQTFTKPANLVVDAFAGNFFCQDLLAPSEAQRIIGREINPSYGSEAMLQLILIHAWQLFSD